MSEDKAADLMSSVLKGKRIHDEFIEQMQGKLLINGQTTEHWQKYFRLEVAYDNLTPAICRDLDRELMRLNQEAALYYAIANARVQMIERGNESLYRSRFNAIVADYKARNERLPANATLETMANAENDDVDAAKTQFQIEKTFWKDILDHLSTVRKILENITWNNKADADMAANYGGIE